MIASLALAVALGGPPDGKVESDRAFDWHVAAGTLGITGALAHLGGMAILAKQPEDTRSGHALLGIGIALPLAGVATTGGGGYWLGRGDAAANRRTRSREAALGWSLLGVGLAGFTATRIIPAYCFTTECVYVTSEVGYFGGLAMMTAGSHFVGHAIGYRDGAARPRIEPTLDWNQTSWSLGLSGRF